MSFLLDVADPSIHFHARQSNTNTPSKGCSSLSKPATSPVETPSKPTFNNTNNSPTITSPQASLAVPVPQSIFSAMSRMIRTASGSNIGSSSNGPSHSAHFFSSSPPSLASSASSTASSSLIATPSEFLEKPRSQSSHSGFHSASTSPWLVPNVCDDEQMNKLVSFQL
ncbi:hypothetical protein BGZ82_008169 [Podila clonocystis]|nr:hypothetical protein BGZ82_008169 [Podila clonocystis]